MTDPALIERITRSLAFMLRHQPETFDLELDSLGFADVEDVVHALNERLGEPVEEEDVRDAVRSGDRPRYEIQGERIRALYGHSIPVEPGPSSKPPEFLFVAVPEQELERARRFGLRGGRRRFLHLALTQEDAAESGRRVSRDYTVLVIHALDAWEEGISFYDRTALWLAEEVPTHLLEVEGTYHDGTDPLPRRFEGSGERPGQERDRGGFGRGGRESHGQGRGHERGRGGRGGRGRGGRGRDRQYAPSNEPREGRGDHERQPEPVGDREAPAFSPPSGADPRGGRAPSERHSGDRGAGDRGFGGRPHGDRNEGGRGHERRESHGERGPRESHERREPHEAHAPLAYAERPPARERESRGEAAGRNEGRAAPRRDDRPMDRGESERREPERIDPRREPRSHDERPPSEPRRGPPKDSGGPRGGFGAGLESREERRDRPERGAPAPAPSAPPPRKEPPPPVKNDGPGFGAGL